VNMTAYYNEFDPFNAQWLRNLIDAGAIAPGHVDSRSITEVTSGDLKGFTQCHFFAGIGVWSHALRQAGWPDDKPVWTGSCPCQPFSASGKGLKFDDERHLFPAWANLTREQKPPVLFGEQVASKDGLDWWDLVQSEFEDQGYAAAATDLCGPLVGAAHDRPRLYFVAERHRQYYRPAPARLADALCPRPPRRSGSERQQVHDAAACRVVLCGKENSPSRWTTATNGFWKNPDWLRGRDGFWRPVEPGTCPVADGSPERLGRLHAYGNAMIAPLATIFIQSYMDLG